MALERCGPSFCVQGAGSEEVPGERSQNGRIPESRARIRRPVREGVSGRPSRGASLAHRRPTAGRYRGVVPCARATMQAFTSADSLDHPPMIAARAVAEE